MMLNNLNRLHDNSEFKDLFESYMHKSISKYDPFVLKHIIHSYFSFLISSSKSYFKKYFYKSRRESDAVKKKYEEIWENMKWSELLPEHASEYLIQWKDKYYLGNIWALSRIHLAVLEKLIAHYKPRKILEVGCGRGLNLILLSSKYPDVEFSGLELSKSGIQWAKQVDAASDLPHELVKYAPFTWDAPRIPGRVQFIQGNASKLPFSDNQFDLVYTRQALEQMEPYRDQVFSEIYRVSNETTVFFEAFRDWNKSGARRYRILAKDYFAAYISDLNGYGFDPILVNNDLPTKSYMGVGLVVAKKSNKSRHSYPTKK